MFGCNRKYIGIFLLQIQLPSYVAHGCCNLLFLCKLNNVGISIVPQFIFCTLYVPFLSISNPSLFPSHSLFPVTLNLPRNHSSEPLSTLVSFTNHSESIQSLSIQTLNCTNLFEPLSPGKTVHLWKSTSDGKLSAMFPLIFEMYPSRTYSVMV